jgi:hypothetical protein
MDAPNSRKLLISIGRERDVSLAQALLLGLDANSQVMLLFLSEELLHSFGDVATPHTLDVRACVVHASLFRALISFAGPTTSCSAEDLVLFRAFDALGLPTIEIQHALVQEGLSLATPAGALPPHYAARSLISWSGPDGIGYLKSVLVKDGPSPWVVRSDHVAVVSAFEAHFFSERDKFSFAIAVTRLAANHPDITFVWRPRREEWEDPTGQRVFALVAGYRPVLGNLVLEENEPFEHVVRRCSGAIAMLTTQVLDLELWEVPILLYATEHPLQTSSAGAGRTFDNYSQAEALWAAFRSHPSAFRNPLGVPSLDQARLRQWIERAASVTVPAADRMAVALDQLAWLDERRAQNTHLEASTAVSDLQGRLDKLEKSVARLGTDLRRASGSLAKIPARLDRVLQRVGQLQRSTLAYKTKKLISGRVFGKP